MTLRQATVRNFKRRNEKNDFDSRNHLVCRMRERSNNIARTAKTTGTDGCGCEWRGRFANTNAEWNNKINYLHRIIPFAVLHGLRVHHAVVHYVLHSQIFFCFSFFFGRRRFLRFTDRRSHAKPPNDRMPKKRERKLNVRLHGNDTRISQNLAFMWRRVRNECVWTATVL